LRLISLAYHDVEARKNRRRYSVTLREFRAHLAAIREAVGGAPSVPGAEPEMSGFALTFDDGHAGCVQAAEALQELDWKAAFFVISGYVGKQGWLDAPSIKRIAGMGHVIGSHTVDHPEGLSRMEDAFILDQWARSKAALEDILGGPVTSASVPGGDYSARVGRAAEAAGVKHLFTSEPVATAWTVGGCRVMGRFALTNGMSSGKVARIAAGAAADRAEQYLSWNLKKAVKSVMMRPYLALRRRVYPS